MAGTGPSLDGVDAPRGWPPRRSILDGPDPEIADLFDRYLGVFADATRRFGNLFPYNHLRSRMLAIMAGRTVRVIVRDEFAAALASFDVEWRDGQFHRVASDGKPAFEWSVDVKTLEDAAAAPWSYLAHPRQLRFAWFDVDGAIKV